MTGSKDPLISAIEERVLLLTRQYQRQKAANKALESECEDLRQENNLYAKELSQLREKLAIVSYALPQAPGANAALALLSQELREITAEVDACIDLLRSDVR